MKLKKVKPNVDVTFPQSNDIYKLLKIGDEFNGSYHKKHLKNITTDISLRQMQYYINTGKYFGLFESKDTLTTFGCFVLSQKFSTVLELFVFLILSDEIFYDYYLNRSLEKTSEMIHKFFPDLGKSTCYRRAKNVHSWINWCNQIILELNLKIEV